MLDQSAVAGGVPDAPQMVDMLLGALNGLPHNCRPRNESAHICPVPCRASGFLLLFVPVSPGRHTTTQVSRGPVCWKCDQPTTGDKMETFFIEIICRPASDSSSLRELHASVCAIATTPDEAEAMACNQVMSHSYVVERVVGVIPTSAVPPQEWDESIDTPLLLKAQSRESRCAVLFSGFDDERAGEYVPLGIPDDETGH